MNPVVHFEMPYEDSARASRFYESAFGWKMQETGPAMGNYVLAQTTETDSNNMVTVPGTINGGMYPRSSDPKEQAPSVVISVPDINASLEKIKAAGGTVLNEPVAIPGVGSYASFIDTEGNRVSVLQPIMPQ